MRVSELESLNQTKSFIHRSANWKVINSDLTQSSLVVDNKEAPAMAKHN